MSGNTLDIITQMPQVGKVHKLLIMIERSSSDEILEMATIGGAKGFKLDK